MTTATLPNQNSDFPDVNALSETPHHQEEYQNTLNHHHFELLGLQEEIFVQSKEIDRYKSELSDLRNDRGKYKSLFESAPIGYLIVDQYQQVLEVNPSCATLMGKRPYQISRSPLPIYIAAEDREALRLMVEKVSKGEHGKLLVHMSTTGYSTPVMMYLHPIRNQSDRTYNCLIAMMDISEHCAVEDQLRNAKNYLHHIATHDPLTDLPNRRRFNDAVEEAIVTARRNGTKVALLMLDLDRFKFINDSLGHDAGDEMLCQTAKRLKAAVGKDDLVARLGGDEFSIILNGVDDISSVETITEAIRDSLATPFQIGNHEVCTAGSVGVCIYPTDSIHSKEMLKFADAAMYRAKSSGRNCVRFFTQSLSLELKRRLRLESDLRAGIKQQDFDVWFQPIVDIHSGKAKSIEALARWRHPQRGLVSPAEFIGLAEECGAIEPLGYWILSQSCRQLVNLHANGFEDLCLSVNISPRQFAQPGIAREVTEILEVTQLDPKYLELEVTESALFDDDKRSMKVMSELRELGIQLAIDDFGTGYSSFSRLRRLPISRIKIDQSFVRGLPYDADDCSITRAIVSMAGDLGMEVVSEGVETLEQLEYLRNLGCSLVQGYFLGEPVPASRIQKLLSSDKPEIQQPPRENVTPLKIVQTTV